MRGRQLGSRRDGVCGVIRPGQNQHRQAQPGHELAWRQIRITHPAQERGQQAFVDVVRQGRTGYTLARCGNGRIAQQGVHCGGALICYEFGQ